MRTKIVDCVKRAGKIEERYLVIANAEGFAGLRRNFQTGGDVVELSFICHAEDYVELTGRAQNRAETIAKPAI